MTEHTDIPASPVQGKGPAAPTPGEILRKLREEKGLTHAAVGQTLHLTGHYIRALEADDYSKLPAPTFVKGYLKSYARLMGADVDTVLGRYDNQMAVMIDAGKQTERVQRSRRRHDQALRWAIGAGFVVVASLVAGWWFMSGEEAPASVTQTSTPATSVTTEATTTAETNTPATTSAATTTTASTTAPIASSTTLLNVPALVNAATGLNVATDATAQEPEAETAAATGADVAEAVAAGVGAEEDNSGVTITPEANGARTVALISVGEDELRVVFNGNSWIEVDDGRSVRLYNDMLGAGDTLNIRGDAPFHVLLGDATQVDIVVNATAIDISTHIRDDSTARLILGELAGEVATEEAPR